MVHPAQITALGTLFGAPHSHAHFYLVDGHALADDDGPGSLTTPFATLNGAIDRLNQLVVLRPGAHITLHISTHTGAGYTWSRMLAGGVTQASVAIVGDGAGQAGDDGFTELLAEQAAGGVSVYDATHAYEVTAAAGLGVNVYRGRTFEVTSGAAVGARRLIRDHTDTAIRLVHGIDGFQVGDGFRIVRPSVEIVVAGSQSGTPLIQGMGHRGRPPHPMSARNQFFAGGNASLLLAQLRVLSTGGIPDFNFSMVDSSVLVAGVEVSDSVGLINVVTQDTQLRCGIDEWNNANVWGFNLPADLGLAVNPHAWVGWGLSLLAENSTIFVAELELEGLLVFQSSAPQMSLWGRWRLMGGSLALLGTGTNNHNSGVNIRGPGSILYCVGYNVETAPRIVASGSSVAAKAIGVFTGAHLSLEYAEVVMTGQGVGVCASSWDAGGGDMLPGQASINPPCTIDAADIAAMVSYGGRIHYQDIPTLPSAPAIAELAVKLEPADPADTVGTFAGLSDGDALLSTTQPGNGSVIMRVRG